MTREDRDPHHGRYIICLNERQLDDAGAFYADELLSNGRRISRARWRRGAIENSVAENVFSRFRDDGRTDEV